MLLIVLLIAATTLLAVSPGYWMISLWTAALTVLLIAELLRFIHRAYHELEAMLAAIRSDDFSPNFSPFRSPGKGTVDMGLNRIMDAFRKLRQEKESHLHYLETVIGHVDQALICYDDEGKIRLHNNALHDLFGREKFTRIYDFKSVSDEIYNIISGIKPGENRLIRYMQQNNVIPLSVSAAQFKIRATTYMLVSFKDISLEMEDNEVDSWQKLIRVLNHEIMNSAIPISTLAGVLNGMLCDDQGNETDLCMLGAEEEANLRKGLQTIEKRSRGLVGFTQSTRSLIHVGMPKFETIQLKSLVSGVIRLMKPELSTKKISLEYSIVPENLTLPADQAMLEQILINLIKNAAEALQEAEKPLIRIDARQSSNDKILIRISDNGSGIPAEQLSQVFVPFFTTKTNGSGIGLSLTRQLMRLHKGSVSLQSHLNGGTTVELKF